MRKNFKQRFSEFKHFLIFLNSFFLEVLGCFTDGVVSLDQDSAAVLKDALLILSSKVQLYLVCDMHDS